jgi:hypothetical protein
MATTSITGAVRIICMKGDVIDHGALIAAAAGAASGSGVPVDVVDTHGFDRSEDSRERFSRHLLSNTYVLCPRGCENYSFRMYEATMSGAIIAQRCRPIPCAPASGAGPSARLLEQNWLGEQLANALRH